MLHKKLLKAIHRKMTMIGFDPIRFVNFVRGMPFYLSDLRKFIGQQKQKDDNFGKIHLQPSLDERFSSSGTAKGHYFHQDLLVARKIFINSPQIHVDVGSRIDGFVAHVASFRPIEVFDVRPQKTSIANINFVECDLTGKISDKLTDYCDSLSCLHALEHFGLGRYGDPVIYDGHIAGWSNLYRMLKKGGKLYFSVPIGPQRIEFNSHRVFSMEYLLELFKDKYNIDFFSFVNDKGNLHENVTMDKNGIKSNFGCWYGCGIFEMTKI